MAASVALRAIPSPTTCCSTQRSSSLTATARSDVTAFSSNSSCAIRGWRVESKGFKPHINHAAAARRGARCEAAEAVAPPASSRVIHGACFVVGDNIDTDQIIPAEYLTLVPSKPEEYEKLGSYAMIGLPTRWGKFIQDGKMKTEYKVVIGGANFGCGSSREHAPVAMGAAGVRAVVAESYARIFFRNSVATGELYPVETQGVIWEENHTGDIVTVDMDNDLLVNHTTGKTYNLKPIGEAGPVIDAGGIFAYARSTGMIASPAS